MLDSVSNVSVETKIKLNKFSPRSYQLPILDAIENKDYKRVLAILPRRCLSGDTHITMYDGSFKLLRNIEVGDKILSFNGNTFVTDIVKNKWSTGVKDTVKVYTYRNENNDNPVSLICSRDHVFASVENCQSKIEWMPLKDINKRRKLVGFNGDETNYYTCDFDYNCYGREELFDIETENNHNFIANGLVVHNSGKDITAFNLCIRACLKKICVIYYVFPTYSQAKKVIWDSITNTGERILDFIPSEVIESKNSQEMKIRFRNGSLLQLVGSDNYDTLMGTNPQGVVFSEYALQDPRAYQYIRPILVANDGWALFISTPRGKNHLWELYNIAVNSPDWFAYKLSVLDTNHIPLSEIEKERQEGLISEDLIQQEYFCSFDMGVEGSYYGKYIDRLRMRSQIGQVPWETGFKVHTAWDLGVRDSTTIIFFQVIGQTIRVIDSYENNKEGLEHYVKVLESKPYNYGKHIAPHDIKVKEWGTGITRLEKARQLGIKFTVAADVSIIDGIEAVRTTLGKMWIDEVACKDLIKAIENYRQEFDAKKKVYKSHPLHDWSSHYADCLRYLCISLPKTRDSLSPEELDQRYNEARYGHHSNMPHFFKDDHGRY